MPVLQPVHEQPSGGYRRRHPENTFLYQLVREHTLTLFAQVRERHPRGFGLPAFVEHEFLRYLDCGILARGFVRVHCNRCGYDRVVGFACKGRAFCPSCTTRRMHDTAAHLVDRVLPTDIPYRQWVLSLPRYVRLILVYHPALVSRVLLIFLRAVFAWQRRCARGQGIVNGRPGAITFVQRFGSALNLNVHFHAMLPDGVFSRNEDGSLCFVPLLPPSNEEILGITCKIYRRVTALVARVEEPGEGEDASAKLYAAAVETSRRSAQPSVPRMLSRRCALVDGFSLHANVHVAASHKTGLELLCRYGARPPLALSRLDTLPDGRVVYRFKRALPDGADRLVLPPVDFLAKLAALVPPPRLHLVRYHGVFAPNAKDRPQVIPVQARAERPPATAPLPLRERRLDWASLLQRVFAVDVLACPRCDGRMKIVSFITDVNVVRRILDDLGLPSTPPAPEPARAPPEPTLDGDPVFDDSIS